MRLLLSAYACEPNKGSEPSVGWNWMKALVLQGHEVVLITRSNNAPSVQAAIVAQELSVGSTYYELPAWCLRWKRWRGGTYFYYLLWQYGAYRHARRLHRARPFDLVHHITFASFRQPSFMGALGIPFIFGPVGGGETMPRQLRRGLSWSGRFREILRDTANALVGYDPLMHFTFSKASLIACTTAETKERIPAPYRRKCVVLPTIGIDPRDFETAPIIKNNQISFLYVGRLLYWKGLHLVLRAFPAVRRHLPEVRLKVVGEGSDLPWLKRIADECGVANCVEWLPWMPHKDIASEYRNNVAFVFPSLHDSGGLVVLEALTAGLPVICLNLGGPGAIVNSSCGVVIDATDTEEETVLKLLAEAMVTLAQKPHIRETLAANSLSRALSFTWERAAERLYSSTSLKF